MFHGTISGNENFKFPTVTKGLGILFIQENRIAGNRKQLETEKRRRTVNLNKMFDSLVLTCATMKQLKKLLQLQISSISDVDRANSR